MAMTTASQTSAAPDAARVFLRGVHTYMALGLSVTGIVAYLDERSGLYAALEKTPELLVSALVAPLALVFLLSYRIEKMNLTTAHLAFWTYTVLVGLSLSGIFELYVGASVARTFFITAGTFAAMSVYGYSTRNDLSRFGSLLLMGLVGLVIAVLVNIFFASTPLQIAIEIVGVVVFVALTAYDTQHIKELYHSSDDTVVTGKKAIIGALTLYLDVVNLFLTILQLRRWGFALVRHSHRMASWSRLLASGERPSKQTSRQSARRAMRWLRARLALQKGRMNSLFGIVIRSLRRCGRAV
jgi:FtsH-binding integral membrane protein